MISGQVFIFWYSVTRENETRYQYIVKFYDMKKNVHTKLELYTQIVSSVPIIFVEG